MARTILLVEDDVDARALMKTALEKQGHKITAVGNTHDAEQYWTEAKEPFDLLISDVRFLAEPDVDGFMMAKKLVDARPGAPVMFISGDRDCFASPAIQAFGDAPFIAKPFNVKKITEAVDNLLKKTYGPTG